MARVAYQTDRVTLYHGDCLDIMPTLPEASVDMVCADPPYGTTACKWDSVIPLEPMWRDLKRVVRPRGAVVMTASQPFTTTLISSNREWFKYCWVWEKSVAGDCMNAKNKPLKKHEDICVFSSGTTANCSPSTMPYFPQGLRPTSRFRSGTDYGATGGSFKVPRPSHRPYVQDEEGYPTSVLKFNNDSDKLHQTQKPVRLMRYLIKTYTNEDETILDFCCGSGTTGIACLETNRKCILIEREPAYIDICCRRLEAAERDLAEQLFA